MVDEKDQEDIADQGDLDTWYDAFKMGFMTLWTPQELVKALNANQKFEQHLKLVEALTVGQVQPYDARSDF